MSQTRVARSDTRCNQPRSAVCFAAAACLNESRASCIVFASARSVAGEVGGAGIASAAKAGIASIATAKAARGTPTDDVPTRNPNAVDVDAALFDMRRL